jgi:transcription antitermination factor NusG
MRLDNTMQWYAVQVMSRHEFKVFDRLAGAGVVTFLPSCERLSKWKDRNKRIRTPLFPGYLFVRINTGEPHARLAVLKTMGVARILGSIAGEPEPVPEEQILSLKKIVDAGVALEPHPYLQEGRRVRIAKGPLTGVEGVLARKSGSCHFVLSVDILRQSTAVKIDADDVEAL